MLNIHIKKYYIWCSSIYLILLIIMLCLKAESSLIISSTGIYLSLLFFIHKQYLEELRAFKDLFTDFNKRYDKLNDEIVDIANESVEEIEAKKSLDDYFNLCSEEYLFYTKGLIIDKVWGSWCRGMKENLRIKQVKEYWSASQAEQSYYGLTSEVIDKGSTLY